MTPSTTFLSSGTGLTIIAIIFTLAIISGIAILMRKAKTKRWAYYFLIFVMFNGVMLLFDQILGREDLRISVISSLGSAALFTLFFFISDRKKDKE